MNKWYINEDGVAYQFAGTPEDQIYTYPNDFHTPYNTEQDAERAAYLMEVDAAIDGVFE